MTSTATAPTFVTRIAGSAGTRLARARWSIGVLVAALAASYVGYHRWWRDPVHLALGRRHTDPIQSMWNLQWVPWALLHGHNPFHTDAIYYPHGVALSWNTLTPTLGLLAAPVTLGLGAQISYAILMTLAPALTALTAFWWLRRHVGHPLPAAVGAFVVGFNPFMAGHVQGHLDLTFQALIPLQLMLIEDLLWRRPRPQRRTAILLGIITALQAGINEELIIITAVAVAAALAGIALFGGRDRRSELVRGLRNAAAPLAVAVGVFAAVASPLLIDQLFLTPTVSLHGGKWRALPADYVLPVPAQQFWFHSHHWTYIYGSEDGVYVGWVLLPVLLLGLWLTRRDRRVRVAAFVLAVMVVLTFGDGHPFGIPLPWHVLGGLPVLTSVLPARFAFGSWLVIAWLLTVWLDRLAVLSRGRSGRDRVLAVAAVIGIGCGLFSLLPRMQGARPLPHVPRAFTATRLLGVPDDAPVFLLPSPTPQDATGMYLQLQARFRFRIPGGYALRPDVGGAAYWAPPSPLVDAAAAGSWSPALLSAARAQLAAQHYRAIVVVDGLPDTAQFLRLAAALTGHAPDQRSGGVEIWHLRGNGG